MAESQAEEKMLEIWSWMGMDEQTSDFSSKQKLTAVMEYSVWAKAWIPVDAHVLAALTHLRCSGAESPFK